MKRISIILFGLLLAGGSAALAQAPVFTTNFYNPCGNDGSNEFLIGQAPATAALDPLKIAYFVSGANTDGSGRDSLYQAAFCASLTATGTGSSACDAAGWTRSTAVGSGSYRILDYTNAADKVQVDGVVARLNYRLASCAGGSCSTTFQAPPATGLIPAGAKFIFCISTGINDTAVAAGDAIDFCGFCGEGPFYVIVASFPSGASGLLTNTYTATTSRYVALTYDLGGAAGITETQAYIHTPATAALTGRNYFQYIPQGANALTNAIALNANTTDCNIAAVVALPVTLSGFTARFTDGKVLLSWFTASEKDADRFDIERSDDALAFRTIGSVGAQGNAASGAVYSFTDIEPFTGVRYYRLKQWDINGKYVYSGVIAVSASETAGGLLVFPNPARDQVHIILPVAAPGRSQLTLVNTSGMLLRNEEELLVQGDNEISLDLSGLPIGIYYLKIQTGQEVYNKTIVVQ